MKGEELGTTQQAFAEQDAFQCGYCTPGQVMAAEGLLRANAAPTLDEIRQGMAGNICRCGTYAHIFKAVARAAEMKRGAAPTASVLGAEASSLRPAEAPRIQTAGSDARGR
jgi:xanthine dehydrogenase YagT iron-sulfur-binding subunit